MAVPIDLHRLTERLRACSERRVRFMRDDGSIEQVTFDVLADEVESLTRWLAERGLGQGSLVGLGGPNSRSWVITNLALLGLRAIPVTIPEEILRDVPPEELADRFELDALLLIGNMVDQQRLPAWCAAVDQNRRAFQARKRVTLSRSFGRNVLSIGFSSGSTGTPKALMVSKAGLENTVEVTKRAWGVTPNDDIFIALPMSNIQQQWLLYMAIDAGCDLSVASVSHLYRALRRLQPTILLGPPAFYEEAEKRYRSKPISYRGWRWALARAARALPAAGARSISAKLFADGYGMFGDRMRLMFVGSAPSRPGMLKLLRDMGLPLFEVYGLTEFGWIAFNLPGRSRVGAVGVPVDGVTVSIDPGGQLVVRGRATQTSGYTFGAEVEQRSVFRDDAVVTGDIGHLDAAGFLFLEGRVKNVITTRAGLKLNPELLEAQIERLDTVSRAVVLSGRGDQELVCVAFVKQPVTGAGQPSLESAIQTITRAALPADRNMRVIIRPADALTQESGLLTSNLKVNRRKCNEVFADVVV